MREKYSLNTETFNFIIKFEAGVPEGKEYSIQELVELFRQSTFHKPIFDTYKMPNAMNKSMWYAIKRSEKWDLIKKGIYRKIKE